MKVATQLCLACLAVMLLSPPLLWSADPQGCYTDPDFGFSIHVPSDWNRRGFEQGNAHILQLNAPAPDTFIQLRVFPATAGDGAASVAASFESNTFPSARRLSETGFTLNGVPGLMATYRMEQAGKAVFVRAFYAVHGGRAYALWSAVPETASPSAWDRVYGVFKTFSLAGETPLDPQKSVPPPIAEPSGAVDVVQLTVGTQLVEDFEVIPRNRIPDAVREIVAVFQWQGRPGNAPFTMRWVQVSKGRVFREFPVKAATGTRGWGKGSIVRGDLRWSLGQWAVEIHHGGSLLQRKTFTIVPK